MAKRTIAMVRQNKNGSHSLVLDNYVTSVTLKDGTQVDLEKNRSFFLNSALETLEYLKDKGIIDQTAYAKRLQIIQEKNIKYEVQAEVIGSGLPVNSGQATSF